MRSAREARRLPALLVSLAFGLPGLHATAQEESAGEADVRQAPEAIEVITVTARKREERLQEIPIAITAFGVADLKDQNIRRLHDITENTPNLMMDAAIGQPNSARIFIRGVGNGDPSIADDPGVGIYIDGVYLPRAQGALFSLSDIERVEVLRGPQGTLYGKNTVGGAVNVITQKPHFEFGGYGEVRVGNLDMFETKFVANVPILVERVAMRVAFVSAYDDGYMRNKVDGDRYSNNRVLAGRVSFLVNATDKLELLLTGDHSREDRRTFGAKCLYIGPGNPFQNDALPEYPAACRQDELRGERSFASDASWSQDDNRTWGSALTATWDFSESARLKSITSWRRLERRDLGDADVTELALAQDQKNDNDFVQQDAWSQELQVTAELMDDRLHLVAGLYGFSEKNRVDTRGQANPFTNEEAAQVGFFWKNSFQINGVGNCVPPGVGPICIPTFERFYNASRTQSFVKTKTLNYAAYTHLTYDVTNDLTLTTGVRYTHERKRTARSRVRTGILNDPELVAASFPSILPNCEQEILESGGGVAECSSAVDVDWERSDRFSAWTPTVNLSYRFSDDLMGYVGWSRGFKSGFLRETATTAEEATEPEILGAWEIGLKSSFFDNRLVFNAAYFQSTYEDIQLTIVTSDEDGNIIVEVDNAGKAQINGAEVEIQAMPLSGLVLTSSVGINAARYKEWNNRPGQSNNKLPGTPALQFNVAAAYTFPLLDWGDLRTRVSWFHEAKRAADVLDAHFTRTDKHGLLSARVALELRDGKTEIALFGSNLLDRYYFANGIDLSESLGAALRIPAHPRQYGLEVRRRF